MSVKHEMKGIICTLPISFSEGLMSTFHQYMCLDRNLLEIRPFTFKTTPCFIILDKSGIDYVHAIFDGWTRFPG